jgi:membrane protease subunit (stomatin/prohibitin family)
MKIYSIYNCTVVQVNVKNLPMTNITKKDIQDAFILFGAQMLSFAIITINYRAVAQASYIWSITTDLVIASLSYFVVKRIAKSKNSICQWAGFAIGSAIGTAIGIFVSLHILGG